MAIDDAHRYPDSLDDEIGRVLREMRSIPTWTARKFEVFAKFERLARRQGYLLFTADMRDYRLSGSGNSCLYQVPLAQRGALQQFAGRFIRVVCGGKSNRYSGRFYYAKPVLKRFRRNRSDWNLQAAHQWQSEQSDCASKKIFGLGDDLGVREWSNGERWGPLSNNIR